MKILLARPGCALNVIREFSSAHNGVCTPVYLGSIPYAQCWHRLEIGCPGDDTCSCTHHRNHRGDIKHGSVSFLSDSGFSVKRGAPWGALTGLTLLHDKGSHSYLDCIHQISGDICVHKSLLFITSKVRLNVSCRPS